MTDIEDRIAGDWGLIADLVRDHAADHPAQAALIDPNGQLTWSELDARMDRVAAALQRDGVQPQQAIAICAQSSTDYAVVFLGALRAGVAVAPLSPGSTPESLARMVADADASLLFIDAASLSAASLVPRDKVHFIALDGGDEPFATWLAPEGTRPIDVRPQPDWPFNIIYSSGTTGAPKGIVQPHGMRWTHVQRGKTHGYGANTVSLLSTPLYSNTTLVVFFPTIAFGGTVILMPKFDAAEYLWLAESHRVTHTMLVPVQYRRLMARPDFDAHDLSSFVAKFCTSAPFAADVKADVVARWPGSLVEFYGMTEGGGTCILLARDHPTKLHTVGQPAEGHDIRLIDDDGREVARGEAGEVVGHSGGMMRGYHGQPEKTREAEWFDASGKRFIRTGDIGRFDDDGFLTLFDRKKDMIISGGFNLYPSDLEAVLVQHPDIADAAVVGVPSAEWGESPMAFVVSAEGSSTTADELLRWANERLGKTQRLVALRFIDELPRSPIGKVLKRELRDSMASR
ncbi:MAG: putative acyl-CoA ligase [Rhizobacter sp.]|nr:putative acyl-CoA ligase [Rhizobacter sp.]